MRRFIVARVVQAAITLLILSVAVFLSVKLTGDPAVYMLGPEQGRIEYEMMRKQLGLDRPIVVQYFDFLTDILRADFGKSHFLERPARDVLIERFPATIQLAVAAFILAVAVGVPLGILSAVKRDTAFDNFGKLFATLGIATPNFWIAIMLILLFGAILGWLPTFGRGGIDHFILPAFVLGWSAMAGMVRLGRSSMLEGPGQRVCQVRPNQGAEGVAGRVETRAQERGYSLANLFRPHSGGSVERVGGRRGGVRLARNRAVDAAGDPHPRFPHRIGDRHGFRAVLHRQCPAGRHPVRIR